MLRMNARVSFAILAFVLAEQVFTLQRHHQVAGDTHSGRGEKQQSKQFNAPPANHQPASGPKDSQARHSPDQFPVMQVPRAEAASKSGSCKNATALSKCATFFIVYFISHLCYLQPFCLVSFAALVQWLFCFWFSLSIGFKLG